MRAADGGAILAGKKKEEEQEQRSLEENFSELEELIAGSRGYLSGGCVYGIQ